MSKHYAKHADELVGDFKELIGASVAGQITHEQYQHLSMLIEAAIGNAVLGELEKAADQASALAAGLRRRAERYD